MFSLDARIICQKSREGKRMKKQFKKRTENARHITYFLGLFSNI